MKHSAFPRHVAIIMDGNGRWAQKRHLPRKAGHVAGVSAVREVVRQACDIGLENMTLYAFSSENWKRPATEVGALMGLFRLFFRNDIRELADLGVRIRIIGSRERISPDIREMIVEAEEVTRYNTGLNLILAFDYGGHEEITQAAQSLAGDVAKGLLSPEDITPERLNSRMYTAGIPAPDLLIRTSGERRLSNFLLWQAAYAELLFVDTLWPDFGRNEFMDALVAFSQRERRFGALPEAVA